MKRKLTKSILLLILFLCFQLSQFGNNTTKLENNRDSKYKDFNLFSSSSIQFDWELIWGSSNHDDFSQMAVDSENNIYLAGNTYSTANSYDVLIAKFNSSGHLQWSDIWGGTGSDGYYGVNIAIDEYDNIYIYGETESYSASLDIFIIKYDKNGLLLWNHTWGGYSIEYVYTLEFDSYNNIYLGGSTYSVPNNNDFCLIKYSTDGVLIWNRTWGLTNMNAGHYLVIDSSDNLYFTGSYDSGTALLKYNETGDLQWYRTRSEGMWPNGILLDSNEDIYVVASGICLFKYNSSGDFKWIQEWGGIINNYGDALLIDSKDNVYVAYRFKDGDFDIFLAKYNPDGTQEWKKQWGGSDYEHCNAMEMDCNDNVFLAGESKSFGAGEEDVFLLRYDSSGNLTFSDIWSKADQDYGEDIAFDSKYNVYLAGDTRDGDKDFFLLKYLNPPRLELHSPLQNAIFGLRPPKYDISIFGFDVDSKWYQIDGVNNTFYEINGTIEQDLWDQCADGGIEITFFANDTSGKEISNSTTVFKDTDLSINYPVTDQIFGYNSPDFDISLFDRDLYNTSYSLNNGINNTFIGLTGKINQTEWLQCNDGLVKIDFYAQDYKDNLIRKEVWITKEIILEPRNAYAIIVAIEDYPDPYSDLYYTIDDANGIKSRLHNYYGFDDTPGGIQYTQVLLDSDATKSDIENAFDYVADYITSRDIFFFYFSGHGHPSSLPGSSYLYPYDLDRIYSFDLDTYLESVNCSEQYIIIDSCGSGGLIDDAQAPNRYFMTASERNEISWETSALGHGVFTNYFLQSFTNALDSNGDGVISMEEQFDYTYPRTVSYSTGLGSAHHPQEYDGITGESVIDTTIGSLMLSPNGTQLDYSFNFFGHGTITTLEITVCCVADNITIETFNIIPEAPSITGFGYYSGNLEVNSDYNITGYRIKAVVDWPKNPPGDPKTIQHIFGDTDGDNLEDIIEIENGINPLAHDTDFDGLDDYFEFYGITNPTVNDTDGDGMLDGFEVSNGLDPLIDDTLLDLDGDGLDNILEYNLGTDPNNPDTDGDTMDDGYEYLYGLNLFADDTGLDLDGDGLINGIECQCGSMANNSDSDADTMPDKWEYDSDLNLLFDDTGSDLDGDGLTNLIECQLGSYANNNDSDSDTMPDKWEYDNDLDLNSDDTFEDPDVDGVDNIDEYIYGTDPTNPDTDGDTWNDGDEIAQGTDPLNPDDYPQIPDAISGYFLFPLFTLSFVGVLVYFKKKQI